MSQKVALVTGSTSGIGLASVQRFAKRGVNVIVTGSRDKSLVDSLLTDLHKYDGVRVDYIQADLSKSSDIEHLFSEVSRLYPDGIDILINNAGCIIQHTTVDFPESDWDLSMAVNLTAPFKLTKHFLPGMKTKGWGRIVNISSVGGVVSSVTSAVYSATKHGLIGLTKGVALENGQYGITCNAVCPALVHTGIVETRANEMANKLGVPAADLIAQRVSQYPIKKVISSDQVAELIEFLCLSDASSQMTGANYMIDCGITAH